MAHVAVIASEPHPIGSEANRAVRDYLLAELVRADLEPELQTMSVPSYYGPGGPIDVVNVFATIPGTSSTGTIVLMAHYDTVPQTPGANDNSAGVATLLETGRALLAGPSLRNDVMLLFPDGEEPAPRLGSPAFVNVRLPSSDIALVVNFEAVGKSGPSMLVETSGSESAMVAQFAAAVPNAVAFSFVGETMKLVGDIGTDFDPFRDAGVPGFHLAYTRGSPIYHTPADDLKSVSQDSLQHHGLNAIGIARRFGDLDLSALPDGSGSVYFTLGPAFIQHPAWVSAAVALIAAAVLATALFSAELLQKPAMTGTARKAGRAIVDASAVVLAMTLGWVVITSTRSSPLVLESYLYLLCLVAVGAVATTWLKRRSSRTLSGNRFGFSVMWVLLGLVTSFAVPGFSYLFVWPALAAALAVSWKPKERTWGAVMKFASVAGPTIILLVPAIEFFFQFGQPRPGNPDSSIPAVAAIAFLLAHLVTGLIQEVEPTES